MASFRHHKMAKTFGRSPSKNIRLSGHRYGWGQSAFMWKLVGHPFTATVLACYNTAAITTCESQLISIWCECDMPRLVRMSTLDLSVAEILTANIKSRRLGCCVCLLLFSFLLLLFHTKPKIIALFLQRCHQSVPPSWHKLICPIILTSWSSVKNVWEMVKSEGLKIDQSLHFFHSELAFHH